MLAGPGSTLEGRSNRIPDNFVPIESVGTSIDDNDQAVDPKLDEIIVTFPQPMDTDGWYVGPARKSLGNFPGLERGRGAGISRFPDILHQGPIGTRHEIRATIEFAAPS